MRTKTFTASVSGVAGVMPLNQYAGEFNVGFGVIKTGTGDITYSVQHTYDGTNWLDHSTVSGQTGTAEGSYKTPVEQVRLNVTAVSGAASLTATFIQQDY